MSLNAEMGVLYIATGKNYLEACKNSASSIKRYCNGLPVHIFTDQPVTDHACFDTVGVITALCGQHKVDYIGRSPFQKTLYLDADTRVCTDITELFELLDRFDMAFAQAHQRVATNRQFWRRQIPYSFPQLNCGVILFKKSEAVDQLLRNWKEAYHDAGFSKDQVTLRELIWMSNLRVAILPPEYNIRYRRYLRFWSPGEAVAKILHYRTFVPGWRRRQLRIISRKIWQLRFKNK